MPDLSPTFSAPKPAARTGTCPICGRDNLPIVGRNRIEAHTQVRMTSKGMRDSGEPCAGSGGAPETGTVTGPSRRSPQ